MTRRGQLVLVAAVVAAIALVPVLSAYLQLGYHADVDAAGSFADPAEDARRVLQEDVHRAAAGVTAAHDWTDPGRRQAVQAVRDRLEPRLQTLERARVARGTVYQVAYNETAARDWAAGRCPGGPDRQFAECRASRGVVVQGRVGETHVLAVAFDVTVTTERGTVESTVVVRAVA